jgi:hypothetical protein
MLKMILGPSLTIYFNNIQLRLWFVCLVLKNKPNNNMYSIEFFSDRNGICYRKFYRGQLGILQLCWNFSMNCSTVSTPPFCSPQRANLWNVQLQKPQIIYNNREKPESHYGTCILKKRVHPPWNIGFLIYLHGMQHLLKNLQRLDMSYLSTKNINQDPAEKFFFFAKSGNMVEEILTPLF